MIKILKYTLSKQKQFSMFLALLHVGKVMITYTKLSPVSGYQFQLLSACFSWSSLLTFCDWQLLN